MIIRGATLFSRAAAFFVMLFTITACGGGGGGDSFLGDPENELRLTLLDPDGNETAVITSNRPGTLQVKLSGSNKRDVVITADVTLGTLIPTTGTALTDSSGIATFQIEAGPERGAGTVNVSAATENGNVTASLGYQIGEQGLTIGYFDDDGMFVEGQIKIDPGTSLAAGGNAELSVVAIDGDGNRLTTVETVNFSSGCIAGGLATINPENPVSTVNGEASTLYSVLGCTGLDEITASLVGTSAQATGSLTVAAPSANAVQFVSAEPQLIVLKGTGGQNRDETSDVVFRVVDGIGQPLQGVTVNFSLDTNVGGITLSTPSAFSDGDGQVQVTVSSGDVATTVRVIATIFSNGEEVGTVSDLLTITTGLPDQNSISLAVSDTFVVENGMRVDGVERELTVSMADKFNNPVVDGTAAVFTTEYGAIVGSCFTVDGVCSVTWRSQEPRYPTLTGDDFIRTIFDPDYNCPSHDASAGPCPDDLGYTRGGRSTITVHAIGEESFVDRNGNGIIDQDEAALFENLPEAFTDHNEDGVYTPALPECIAAPMGSSQCIAGQEEIFIDFNSNQAYDLNDSPAVYNGLLCPPEGDGVWCSRELVHVRDDIVVTLSAAPVWDILLLDGRTPIGTTEFGETHTALISDLFNSPPPGGSEVSVSAEGDCELLSDSSFEVPNFYNQGAYAIPVLTVPPENPSGDPGFLRITLDPVGDSSYTEFFNCEQIVCDGFSPEPPDCDPNNPTP